MTNDERTGEGLINNKKKIMLQQARPTIHKLIKSKKS